MDKVNLPIKLDPKKAKSESSLPQTGIIFPIAFSLNKYDWSKLEHESGKTINRLITAITDRFQRLFREMIEKKKPRIKYIKHEIVNSRIDGYLEGFEPDYLYSKDALNIRILLSEFGVSPNYYNALRDILKVIYQVGVQLPEKGDDGIEYVTYKSLCSCSFPRTGRKDYVIVHIEYDVLNALVNMDFGYKLTSKDLIVASNKSLSTMAYRIYLLISSYEFKGSIKLSLEDLRGILGITGNSYKEVWRFRQKVLEKSKIRLEQMCELGTLDLYFSYEISDDNKFITFYIHKGKLYNKFHKAISYGEVKEGEEVNSFPNKDMEKLFSYLQEDFELDSSTAARIVGRANDANIQGAISREITLKELFDDPSKSSRINNKKAYIISVFNNYFEGKERDIDDARAQVNVERNPHERWNIFINAMRRHLPDEVYRDTFGRMTYSEYVISSNRYVCNIENEAIYNMIESHVDDFSYYFRYILGRGANLGYRFLNK